MKNRKLNAKSVCIIVFLILFYLPLAQQYTHAVSYPQLDEKREKAKFPDFSWSDARNGKLFSSLEKYYADHFGFRDLLIQSYNSLNVTVFNKAPTQDIIIGKKGWLFLSEELKDYSKKTAFEQEIDLMVARLEKFSMMLHTHGIQFLFIISPNKSTLYPENMPDSIAKPRSSARSRYELLDEKLKKSVNLNYLDLRPVLFEKKKSYLMYPGNDSHWTYIGAYFVSLEMLNKLELMSRVDIEEPKINFDEYLLYDQLWGGEGDIEKLLGVFQAKKIIEAKQPEILFGDKLSKLPKTVWYQTSFTDKTKAYITPYFSEINYLHYQKAPMERTLKQNLKDTKIVVFELTERWLGELFTYNFPDIPI